MDQDAHFRFEDLAPGVTVGIARKDGTALSNTGLVELGEARVAFDTSLTLRSAREILARSGPSSGSTPPMAINSHWHMDHLLGNQLFAPGAIYATRRTIEIVHERQGSWEKELQAEELRRFIAETEAQLAATTSEYGRAQFEEVLRLNRALWEESTEIRLTPPDHGFDGELVLPGRSGARLITFGGGHTESDAVLLLPRERVLFAGDLVVVGSHPNLTSGNPEHWLEILDRIEGLGPRWIVPGHGPVADAGALATRRSYLSTILELGDDPNPEMPREFRDLQGPEQFRENLEFLRARRAGAGPKARAR
jgi:cyclase